MAELDINIRVKGEEKLRKVKDTVEKLGEKSKVSALKLGALTVALSAVGVAINDVYQSSRDYQLELDKINGTTNKLTISQDNLSASYKKMSWEIMEAVHGQGLLNDINETFISITEDVITLISGKSRMQIKAEKMLHAQALLNIADEEQRLKQQKLIMAGMVKARAFRDKSKQIEHTRLVTEARAEASQALQHYNDQLATQAEKERLAQKAIEDANRALREKISNMKAISNALMETSKIGGKGVGFGLDMTTRDMGALGDKLSELGGKGATNAQLIKIYEDGIKKTTKAVETTTKAVDKQTANQYNIYNNGGGNGGTGGKTHLTAEDYTRIVTGGAIHQNTGLINGTATGIKAQEHYIRGGKLKGRGIMQDTEDNSARDAENKAKRLAARKLAQEKKYLEALSKVTRELDEAFIHLANATDFLDKLTKALNSVVNDLSSIIDALDKNWTSSARDALYGGTDKGLSYQEAKYNADSAWSIYQSDILNQDYVDNYNKRMNELIGTLDDMNDSSRYDNKQQQDWAKATALYEISLQEASQDVTKDTLQLQLDALNAILLVNQNTDENTQRANSIADATRSDIQNGDTNLLTASNAITTANKDINDTNALIEKKKTEKANLANTRWTETSVTSNQVWTGAYDRPPAGSSGTISKIYETVLTPNFGYVSETGQSIGFKSGGYTGNGGVNDVAGAVHGQEYVLNAKTTRNLGLNDDNGGTFKEIASMIYEQLKVSKRMYNLEKQMYKMQKEAVA